MSLPGAPCYGATAVYAKAHATLLFPPLILNPPPSRLLYATTGIFNIRGWVSGGGDYSFCLKIQVQVRLGVTERWPLLLLDIASRYLALYARPIHFLGYLILYAEDAVNIKLDIRKLG